ncbi:MAG TPA: hypothetical protein VF587_18590 [Solirubrobacteraceae bacterium]
MPLLEAVVMSPTPELICARLHRSTITVHRTALVVHGRRSPDAGRVARMEFMAIALIGTAVLAIGPMVFTAIDNRKKR